MQRLAASQAGADVECKTPQALGLGGPTPEWDAAIKVQLELTLKLGLEGGVMLGGTQQAIDCGDQGNMSLNGLKVPQLILVKPFGLSLFAIDFNRPAVASDAALCVNYK